MSQKEIKRAGIIEKVLNGELKQVKASELLELSDRQIRRMVKVVKEEGPGGLAHKNRGRVGNRKIGEKIKAKILNLKEKKYYDFGPTLASEMLLERDKVDIDHETLRRWLLEKGEKQEWQRKKRPHRKWRERRSSFGEMVQMDGSHHNWLESRGPKIVLMGYVDDATGEKFGKFHMYEGTVPAMDSFREYVKKYGVPLSVYLDKHSAYKTTRKANILEELNDKTALTQFARAMEELSVQVIHAHSAQAKGRVENMFNTLQDRLVKEMRLACINTLEEANKFLKVFFKKYNNRFRVKAKNGSDLHRRKPSKDILEKILCNKEERSLKKDSTVRDDNKIYRLTEPIVNRAKNVILEKRLDGTVRINYKGRYLKYEVKNAPELENQKKAVCKAKSLGSNKKKKSSKPGKNHPWRKDPPFEYIDPKRYLADINERVLSGV